MKPEIKAKTALVACWLSLLSFGLLLAGCGESEPAISRSTTCKDYLSQPGEIRHDAAARISAEIDGVESPGNPMWGLSLDASCGANPSRTVGQVFRHE